MGIERDARLVVNRELDLRGLPLTPADFYLFSRIEALSTGSPPTVAAIVAASGQPAQSVEQTLEKLIELGALRTSDAQPQPSTPETSSATLRMGDDVRERARVRRRSLLEAQLRAAQGEASRAGDSGSARADPESGDQAEQLPVARDQPSAPPPTVLGSILDEVEPVAATDPRLEHSSSVSDDRQRRLLALRDRLRHVGHFELLGLEPVDDPKLIRRAYHLVSREFHPDSHYGKNLGSFAEILDALFRRARASYEVLMDDQRRRPLVEAHLAQVRAEHDQQAARERVQVEAREQAKREADRVRERAALEARAERERERQARFRERMLAQRRKQAIEHAEQALREQANGRHGTAATLFRLAHEHDPNNSEYRRLWQECLTLARRERAATRYEEGKAAARAGRMAEAAHLLGEAADADPSLRHLSEAARIVAEVDSTRAREFAMAALEALQQAQARADELDQQTVAGVHYSCAKAFLAAGQQATAREQAERAHQLAPTKHTRTLLNSIKLT